MAALDEILSKGGPWTNAGLFGVGGGVSDMKEFETPCGCILQVRRERGEEGWMRDLERKKKWGVFLRAQMAVSSGGTGMR